MNELEIISQKYDPQDDFDSVLAYYTAKIITPQLLNKSVLEAGCSTGMITNEILKYSKELDVIDGSSHYIDVVKNKYGSVINNYYTSYFEEFTTVNKYDSVVLAHVLHHIESPLDLLIKIQSWLNTNGEIFITVPNISSFHRELGVEMNISKTIEDSSIRNDFFKQPGRFQKETLIDLVEKSCYQVVDCYNYFFKPFSHNIMHKLLTSNIIDIKTLDGLYTMGKKHESLACHIYLKAIKK